MIKKSLLFLMMLMSLSTMAAVEIGDSAPSFSLKAEDGKYYGLDKYKGKVIVLEWLNHGCPFVRKYYDSGNMQSLQQKYTEQGVVWLSIVSSAEGKQGHVDASGAFREKQENSSKATHILLDPTGEAGQKYAAKTTPHMYVIDEQGKLIYQGAIDSIPSTDKDDIAKAQSYISLALDAKLSGEEIKITDTKAYGCSVKY